MTFIISTNRNLEVIYDICVVNLYEERHNLLSSFGISIGIGIEKSTILSMNHKLDCHDNRIIRVFFIIHINFPQIYC